ncbi:hypothetical protein [Bdellovibrio sp. HCB337]|uniref:hypothetical protein n=1 Tax=Bdellovibrio sp. HCB337 TaxID=3394358 RepID=UPI0039A5DB5E
MKHVGILLSTTFLLAACASSMITNRAGVNIISQDGYEDVVDKWSDHIEDYNGLNNTVTVHATLLGSEAALAQVDQNARLFQWDQVNYDNEKKLAENRMAQETQVFVSFYSPERKWDDLYKSKTLWKVFLDANGQRYEGKVTKIKLLTREVQSLYHYHTSFATPYTISFPVAARSLDGHPVKLVFTGAIGSVNLNFGPK